MMWSAIEKRIVAADIADDERVRLQRTITFAQRYIAQREARATSAPTPTAAARLVSCPAGTKIVTLSVPSRLLPVIVRRSRQLDAQKPPVTERNVTLAEVPL